ncbi:MAG: HEAT repeat domain-containing protein [Nitrospira sp.]|nr:HEAT repeat domain-containing protein [Nitrospira sp.]
MNSSESCPGRTTGPGRKPLATCTPILSTNYTHHELIIFLTNRLVTGTTSYMSDLQAAQDIMAAATAAKKDTDQELNSVIQLLKALDRASRNIRTFGQRNSVAQKFFIQFFTDLSTHLAQYSVLTFMVQREGLIFKESLVYGSQTGDASENFAFKFYSDGIREITFHQDITEEDILFFFDALWGTAGTAGTEDDDIVTRLWAKNLPTLTIVTADEVMKVSELDSVLTPQMNKPQENSLREIVSDVKAKEAKDPQDRQRQKSRLSPNVMGYEVSEEELSTLAKEIAEESGRDNILYLLDILTAILSSERSPVLLGKLLEIYKGILISLIQGGHWTITENVLGILGNAESLRQDLTDEHKKMIHDLFENLGSSDTIGLIETYLNTTEMPRTDGLAAILLTMKPSAVPALCALLGNLEQPAHQTLVTTALLELAIDTPELVAKHLTDRRPGFVRNILGILTRWNNPRLADNVEKILRYPDPLIRRETVRTLAVLRPNGTATKLIPLMNDQDENVRLTTLKSLLTGNYTAPFSSWAPIVNSEEFGERPPAERRNIFHAMRLTTGDEAVPYWTGLLTEWGWTNRKKREDLALMAIDALGKLGTAAAQSALEAGTHKGPSAVRQACATALLNISKQIKTA